MHVTLYMAMTVNGIIARENYAEDFLSDEHWKVFVKLAEKAGCIIVGRKTYQKVQQWKEYTFDDVDAVKIIVSHNTKFKTGPDCFCVTSPRKALETAHQLGFRKVLLAGGSILNSSFIKKGLIDEMIINIEPCVLGKGIPLFSNDTFEGKLHLMKITKLKSGIVQLHYKMRAA